MLNIPPLVFVVPAAGIGKRMQAGCPKQYLKIGQQTILEHTLSRLLSHPRVALVIVVINPEDQYFFTTPLSTHSKIKVVDGGAERVDSVLSGLKAFDQDKYPWVLVHDAARPCVKISDIDKLINACINKNIGGILASPIKDTMKRSTQHFIKNTVERENLWHALTPQMFPTKELKTAIELALKEKIIMTDEASAIEYAKGQCQLIEGCSDNIKITQPNDLALAEFNLNQQQNTIRN